MSVTFPEPQPNAALVVGPDDHLVISLPADTDVETFEAFMNGLYTNLDRDRVTVVCGAEQIAVVRGTPPPEPMTD